MVVSLVALTVALGGTSYAAIVLPANSVGSKQIKPKGVKGSDIAGNAVTSPKVKNGSLLSADFKAGQLPAGAPGATGPKGDTGLPGPAGKDGTNGTNGAPGQPQKAFTFKVDNVGFSPTPIPLFPSGGLAYTFQCLTFVSSTQGQVMADGAGWSSFGDTVFQRPPGEAALPADRKVFVLENGVSDGRSAVAVTFTAADNDGGTNDPNDVRQTGSAKATVETAVSVTYLTAYFSTGDQTCSVRGTAFTVGK